VTYGGKITKTNNGLKGLYPQQSSVGRSGIEPDGSGVRPRLHLIEFGTLQAFNPFVPLQIFQTNLTRYLHPHTEAEPSAYLPIVPNGFHKSSALNLIRKL
jgi:hypothetical protein